MNMLEVIHRGARGMSDDQRDNEYGCQARLAKAIYEMEQALKMAKECSTCWDFVPVCTAFDEFVHDNIPGTRQWEEKIERARS